MSKNLGDYIVAWLIIIVIGIGVSFVISIVAIPLAFIPCCGWIAAWVLFGRRPVSGHRSGLWSSLRPDRRGAARSIDLTAQRVV